MSLFSMLLGIAFAVGMIAWLLFLIFGQITVRKLRKTPELKHELGTEFISGWDIFNVAEALSLPRPIMRKFKNSRLSFLYADPDILRKYTDWFDIFLAKLFFWPFFLSGFTLIVLMISDWFSVFD